MKTFTPELKSLTLITFHQTFTSAIKQTNNATKKRQRVLANPRQRKAGLGMQFGETNQNSQKIPGVANINGSEK